MIKISVVMSVYNEADTLRQTLMSVLTQQGVDFELIVVNDGSTDNSAAILNEFTVHYPNLKVIHQSNTGLTQALIRGCEAAQGEFIARQDCGDISLPGRLEQQACILEKDSSISLVSTWVDFVESHGEYLHTCSLSISRSSQTLSLENVEDFLMPGHHGCTMFRNSTYSLVGGYRASFYFAQDRDLWTRLIEKGDHLIIPQVLYKATININSISGKYSLEQRNLTNLINQATLARRKRMNENLYLEQAQSVQPKSKSIDFRRRANSCYFIGSCLLENNNIKSLDYFLEATKYDRFHYKSYIKILLLIIKTRCLNVTGIKKDV